MGKKGLFGHLVDKKQAMGDGQRAKGLSGHLVCLVYLGEKNRRWENRSCFSG
jgi:hypothetical protein